MTAEQLAVSLIHEMGHQELFLINLLDRLVNSDFDYNLVHAPFQGKERPPIGRLHSLFDFFRMIQFERSANLNCVRHEELYLETENSFENGELTFFARELIESIHVFLFGNRRNLAVPS